MNTPPKMSYRLRPSSPIKFEDDPLVLLPYKLDSVGLMIALENLK
jgi:hypothetical protein